MFSLFIALHYYFRQPSLLIKTVSAYLAEAARSGLKEIGLIVTDEVSTDREREELRLVFRRLKAEYNSRVSILHFHNEAQARFLRHLGTLKRWFELPLYSNGRLKSILAAVFLHQPKAIAFADLDTAPVSNDKNLFRGLYDPFENPRVMGVSGDYTGPRPLTDAFLKPEIRPLFHEEVNVCNNGLGPVEQSKRLIGGCMALNLELIKRFVPPPIPMCVWSDDAFPAVAVTEMGFEVVDSGLTVFHDHPPGRLDPEWMVSYLAQRVSRGIALMPIWHHCKKVILDFLKNGKSFPQVRLEDLLVGAGWDESVKCLDRYAKVLKLVASNAIDDVRKNAVLEAAEKVSQELDFIVSQVALGFADWISYLKDWQKAMDLIQELDPYSDTGKEIADSIRI